MATDNRTNEPTPEQVEAAMFQLFPITVRYDGCDVPNPGAADKREGFKAGIEYMRGLLSEGAPSDDAVRDAVDHVRCAVEFQDAISPEAVRVLTDAVILARPLIQDPAVTALVAEAREWAKYDSTGASKIVIELCAALTAAGVASQEVIDDAADEQDDLRLHMLAPQEPSRLPDFFAPKPMPNSYVPAPVLPSSICQHNMVSYTDSVSEKPENFCSLCGYQPSSGVDEETLANLIHSTSVAHFGGLDPRVAPIIARAVTEWLKGQGR